MKKLALALLLLVIAPQAHAEENDSAEREFGGRKSAPDEPVEPSALSIEPIVAPKPTTTVTAPAPAPTALAPEAKQPETTKPKATYVCRKELSNNRKASAVQTCAVPVTNTAVTQVTEGKVSGLFNLSVGGHRGPRERISGSTQGGSLSVMGGGVYNAGTHVGVGVIGLGRVDQERGIGSAIFSEWSDAYSATIDMAPIVVLHGDAVDGYAYGGVGVKANLTYEEVIVGGGVSYHKNIFGVGYDAVYRTLRADYDQFMQRVEFSIRPPVEVFSVGVNVHNLFLNPDDGLVAASREQLQWGVGGGAFVGVHIGDVTLKATGNMTSSAGLNGALEITKGIALLQ